MLGYRKLGRTSSQRKAMLRNLTTDLLYYGRIKTTETRAKEVRKSTEKLIALAVKEANNYDEVEVTAKVPKKEKVEGGRGKGGYKRVKEDVNGKKVTVYEKVTKTVRKDRPSRLNARRKILSELYGVTQIPTERAGRRANTVKVNMANKLFDDIAPKYADRNGGYTRIVKLGQRKGDGALEVIIELV